MWASKPVLLWEKLGVLNSLLMWEHLAGSGVYGKIVSPAYLIVGFLSFAWCIGVTQLVLGFFFFLKEIVLYVTADPVYPCVWFAILN